MFELHWIIAANEHKKLTERISKKCRFSFFWVGANFHIFTLLPFTFSFSGLWNLLLSTRSPLLDARLEANQQTHIFLLHSFRIHEQITFRFELKEITHWMCEVEFFCSFNVTFYAWLMKNIDKQINDERFVLRSEVLLIVLLQNIATCL